MFTAFMWSEIKLYSGNMCLELKSRNPWIRTLRGPFASNIYHLMMHAEHCYCENPMFASYCLKPSSKCIHHLAHHSPQPSLQIIPHSFLTLPFTTSEQVITTTINVPYGAVRSALLPCLPFAAPHLTLLVYKVRSSTIRYRDGTSSLGQFTLSATA